jgi:hypothetical protein
LCTFQLRTALDRVASSDCHSMCVHACSVESAATAVPTLDVAVPEILVRRARSLALVDDMRRMCTYSGAQEGLIAVVQSRLRGRCALVSWVRRQCLRSDKAGLSSMFSTASQCQSVFLSAMSSVACVRLCGTAGRRTTACSRRRLPLTMCAMSNEQSVRRSIRVFGVMMVN